MCGALCLARRHTVHGDPATVPVKEDSRLQVASPYARRRS
jgi:UDP-glucose 4-epimerase